jgi:peptidoglycan/LPS O-acetylase OafA/YrhL
MRGVAALGVLSFHVVVSATSDFPQLDSFYLFVDFFFVLSGFVLLHSMPQKPATFVRDARVFITKRAFRFWPLTILSVVVALFALSWERSVLVAKDNFSPPYGSLSGLSPSDQAAILAAAFLLLQIFSAAAIAINVPLWSLSAEWFANLIYTPLVMVKYSLGILAAIALGYFFLWYGLTTDAGFIEASGPIRGFEALGRALIGFGIGLLVARYFSTLSRWRNKGLFVLSLAAAGSFYFLEKDWHWDSYRYAITYFAAIVFAFFILQLTQFTVSATSKTGRIMTFFGVYSFGIYVFHQPLIQWSNIVLGTPTGRFPESKWVEFFLVQATAITLVSIALTFIARLILDIPAQKLSKKIVARIRGSRT